jgi:hypothetical protein
MAKDKRQGVAKPPKQTKTGDNPKVFPERKKRKTKIETQLEKVRNNTRLSMKKRQTDGQTVSWDAFGRDNVKLYHNPITKQNIKRKYYKRWSDK